MRLVNLCIVYVEHTLLPQMFHGVCPSYHLSLHVNQLDVTASFSFDVITYHADRNLYNNGMVLHLTRMTQNQISTQSGRSLSIVTGEAIHYS